MMYSSLSTPIITIILVLIPHLPSLGALYISDQCDKLLWDCAWWLRVTAAVQWLMYNDCMYRARNTMELVMFNDRNEFINLRHHHPRTNLRQFFLEQFDKPEVASVAYWHAKYYVHCKMDKVRRMLQHPFNTTAKMQHCHSMH